MGLGHPKLSKLNPYMTGKELFEKVSQLMKIDPSILRIVVEGKEIYPNRAWIVSQAELVVVNLKLRLLGGVKLKQEVSKTIKLDE